MQLCVCICECVVCNIYIHIYIYHNHTVYICRYFLFLFRLCAMCVIGCLQSQYKLAIADEEVENLKAKVT